uniref:Glycerol-3-phosphate acyltransferase RAM2/GPAT1-8 HAD-like domain-containing protein n=1 Tax=Rhizophora mucronata TaxID=61149 RepID=A0A2P2P6Y4_RHIMU
MVPQASFSVHPEHELSSNTTLIFHVEEALLKSPSIFPYFMLVAFAAGGLLRVLLLLLLYLLICLVGQDMGLKIMVFVSFVGIKAKSFRVGTTVLPKFFLEDVGHEGFDFPMGYRRKVGLSDLPEVMVEGFLRHYMGIEDVVGRELKVVCGYFVGLMEAKRPCNVIFSELFGKGNVGTDVVGFGCFS